MKEARWRVVLRWTHIILGVVLLCYIYSPFSANQGFQVFIKFIIVPAIAVSGLYIWKFAFFNKIFKINRQ